MPKAVIANYPRELQAKPDGSDLDLHSLMTEALSLTEPMRGRARDIVHQKEWRLQPPDSVEAVGGPLSGVLQIEAA